MQHINLELEKSIIGTLLTSFESSIKLFDKTDVNFFYHPANQKILEKAKTCFINKNEFTEFTAIEHLSQCGFDKNTATAHVVSCVNYVITSYALKNDLKILEQLYRKRELENILREGIENNSDFETNIEEILKKLYNLRKNNKDSKKKMKDMLTASLEYLHFLQSDDNGKRVDTGFPLLDSILKGMFKGQLIGLAGRPSCGKSALSTNIGINVAKKGSTVVIFSQEMEAYEIVERMLANQAYIPMDNLIEKLNNVDAATKDIYYTKIINKSNEMSKLPIFIADLTRLTTVDIRTECQQFKDLGLVIIDYLQLMVSNKREQNRNLEIAQITRELKILASDLQCPILLLSQLNRAKDETDKPSLNDYRDSGAIEQDLVKSMMLWKTDIENKKVGLTINKNRRGSTGDIELKFNGSYMMYTELGIYTEPKKKRKKGNDWGDLD